MNVSQVYLIMTAIYISHALPKELNVAFGIVCLLAAFLYIFLGY